MPVEPSRSRSSSSRQSAAGSRPSAKAARPARASITPGLSAARTPVSTRPGATRSAMPIRRLAPRSVRGAQPVADARLGEDVARPGRVGLDLLAQAPDVDPHVLRVGLAAPDLLEEELVGQHLAGVGDEGAQDVVLLGRELDLGVVHPDGAADEVDREVAAAEEGPLALKLEAVAERRADAGQELVDAERLGHVVVGPEVERLDLAGLVV